MSLSFAALIMLIAHVIYHIIATVGVMYSLWHSNTVHQPSPWKIVAILIWMGISFYATFTVFTHRHNLSGDTHQCE